MARPLQVEGETQPCVIQGAQGGYRRPQNTGLRAGSHGEMRAADLRSAAPAGGAPAQHPEVRTRAPAAPAPSGSSTWGGDGTLRGEPRLRPTAPSPPCPTLKPFFLSELSDLRPSRLRLGEAWVQRRPPSDHRRWVSRPPGLRGSGGGRPQPLPNTDPSFPVPGSPHLNFGGARAAKLSADLERTPAPAAHRAPGEEREGGGEGEGAGLGGGIEGGPRPDTYRLSESSGPPPPRGEGEGRGGEAALGSGRRRRGALRSSRAARRAGAGAGLTPPPPPARGGEEGEPAAPAPPPPPRRPN